MSEVRTIHLRRDESFAVDAQVTIIRSVYWSEIIQRYVIEYELGRCDHSDGCGAMDAINKSTHGDGTEGA